MPRNIVDLAARSRVFRAQSLLSHAWVATPSEVIAFLQSPRAELRKIGVRLDSTCEIETFLQNHDWLAGRSKSLTSDGAISVFARGEGDGRRFYRVSFYATKAARPVPARALLHRPDEEEKPPRPTGRASRISNEASRRSMLASPLHPLVHAWLSPVTVEMKATKSTEEAHRIFAAMVELVREGLSRQEALRSATDDLAQSLQQPFNPSYLIVFDRHRREGTHFHQAFTGVMYARAIWYLRTYGAHRDAIMRELRDKLADPAQSLTNLAQAVRGLHRDFVAHAVTEATIRRQTDDFVAERLSEAERLFGTFDGDRGERSARFAAPARRLSLFDPSNRDEWWFLPGLVAFAMSCMAGPPATEVNSRLR